MKGSMKNILINLYIFLLFIIVGLYLLVGIVGYSLFAPITIETFLFDEEFQAFSVFCLIILVLSIISIVLIFKAKNKTNATIIDYFVAFVPFVVSIIISLSKTTLFKN